jgi:phosphoglycerol transferase MdoB-like AlkP superfamily enzyme
MQIKFSKQIKTGLKIVSIITVLMLVLYQTMITSYAYQYDKQLEIIIELINTFAPLIIPLAIINLFNSTNKKITYAISFLITIYYILNTFLVLYRLDRNFTFDFYFLWYNLSDALETAEALVGNSLLVISGFSLGIIALYYGITQAIKYSRQIMIPHKRIYLVILITSLSTIYLIRPNEIINIVRNTNLNRQEILQVYYNNYKSSIDLNKKKITRLKNPDPNNIFMIHLESINAELVNSATTPQLINLSNSQGILFPRIQSSSMLTIRSQEVLLCGILPSLGPNISRDNNLTKQLNCLPKILKENGYNTMFFQSYSDLKFANTDVFLKNIGFEETHSKDIMKPSDKELKWGYPEDVFYKRVFEYLKKYQNKKIFAYIAVSSTNHYPFYDEEKKEIYPEFKEKILYKNPINIKEKIADTTYIQDNFFGEMFTNLFIPRYGSNSHLFVYGDHSWPIEIHKGNKYNENQAFQENFVSSLAFFPARQSADQYKITQPETKLHSHLDVMNSILEVTNITQNNQSGDSFYPNMLKTAFKSQSTPACLVSVQPFANRYIATVEFPIKKVYNTTTNTITIYNLETDPDEMNSVSNKIISKTDLNDLDKCLKSNNKENI